MSNQLQKINRGKISDKKLSQQEEFEANPRTEFAFQVKLVATLGATLIGRSFDFHKKFGSGNSGYSWVIIIMVIRNL